jgi:uncharacterized protein (TIGR02284 family)
MANADVMETLHRLIETCREAEHAFLAAADAVPDVSIKRLFTAYAAQRARFVTELERELRRLDETAGTTVNSPSFRTSTDRAATLAGLDEDAVLAEIERRAWIVRRTYEDALRVAALPADVRSLIGRQSERVAHTHHALQALKRAA